MRRSTVQLPKARFASKAPSAALPHIVCAMTIIVLILVCLMLTVMNFNEYFTEHFGSTCMDFMDVTVKPRYPVSRDKIFISVASYRDDECSDTLKSIFEQAAMPENIVVGICQQNKEGEEAENCLNPKMIEKYSKQIRIKNMSYKDAKGPTYARYWCSTLWQGEEYFLQIDSHTHFQKNWDTSLIKMFKQCEEESSKPILTVYPPTEDQVKLDGSPEMCNGKLSSNDKIPIFLAGWTGKSDRPKRCPKPFSAAGFKFLRGEFLYEVPYDPNMPHLFMGEEVLLSARLWTHGYDFFTPNINICWHHYGRVGKVKYWDDIKEGTECRIKSEKRILFMLGMIGEDKVESEFLRDHHKYGFGTKRKLEDYWLASGIDMSKDGEEGIEDWCNNMDTLAEKFKGWNFKKHGFLKINKL